MNKKLLLISFIVIIIFVMPFQVIAQLTHDIQYINLLTNFTQSQNSDQKKKWTFMFYADSDFMPNYGGLSDIISFYMCSSNNTNILVLQDPNPDPATIWYVEENHDKVLLEELGEINMGDYTSLKNFIVYSKNNFPAERYMLVLWDHGMAWDGACIEITDVPDGKDHLTMAEIQRALKESNGVNIIGFSACVMGCIESAYELRNYTEVYFGSEEQNGFNGWPWQDISNILNVYYDESTYDISKKIMNKFEEKFPYFGSKDDWKDVIFSIQYYHFVFYPPALTMSAIRTDKLDNLVASIDNLSKTFIDDFNSLDKKIDITRFRCEDFPRPMISFKPNESMGSQIDIFDFVNRMARNNFLKPKLSKSIADVKINLKEATLEEHHQIGHRNAHGLSIYFPYKESIYSHYDPLYSTCDLDFIQDTNWDEFLEIYFN